MGVIKETIQNFGQFWPFLVLWGPDGGPTDPSHLIFEVYHNLLYNIFKRDQPQVIGSIRLGVIKETIQDFGQFWPFLVLWGPCGGLYGPLIPHFGS